MALVVIVGLGVSGLGCAVELVRQGIPFSAYEKENGPGGLARTDAADGFRFDYGPHILLELPEDIAEWFGGLPGLDLAMCTGPSGIAMDARLESVIPAPFQQNLNWLPLRARARLLFDAVASWGASGKPPGNYSEYAVAQRGRGIYELFIRGYDSKRLRFALDQIPADWTNRIEKTRWRSLIVPRSRARVPGAGRRESRFFYPRSGAMEALRSDRWFCPGRAASRTRWRRHETRGGSAFGETDRPGPGSMRCEGARLAKGCAGRWLPRNVGERRSNRGSHSWPGCTADPSPLP
jgi:glycine/D-amino acid oxidase-like deaminating enzyme